MSKQDGGPAFPIPANDMEQKEKGWWEHSQGMTLRDYFAAKVINGIVSNPELEIQAQAITGNDIEKMDCWMRGIVRTSFQIADDMLKERDK